MTYTLPRIPGWAIAGLVVFMVGYFIPWPDKFGFAMGAVAAGLAILIGSLQDRRRG